MSFFTGSPEQHERVSTLLPNQQPLYNQLQSSLMGRGAGGAFGQSADYYRSLFDEDNDTFNSLANPEQRRFREEIIPGLSEQFAGMGAGGLSSSGFRNAAVNAGTDLSERLGAIRANLRQQGAQGLQQMGQFGLGNFSQDVMTQPGTEGFLSNIAPLVGGAIGSFGGPALGALGSAAGKGIANLFGSKGKVDTSNIYGAQR